MRRETINNKQSAAPSTKRRIANSFESENEESAIDSDEEDRTIDTLVQKHGASTSSGSSFFEKRAVTTNNFAQQPAKKYRATPPSFSGPTDSNATPSPPGTNDVSPCASKLANLSLGDAEKIILSKLIKGYFKGCKFPDADLAPAQVQVKILKDLQEVAKVTALPQKDDFWNLAAKHYSHIRDELQ